MKILVFAGGNGTRLWPVSRLNTPKQFQKLVGDTSLFSLTLERLLSRYPITDTYIVVPEIYRNDVRKYAPDLPEENIIIEPYKWDTFASIGYASFTLFQKFPHENFFYVWSDHMVKDPTALFDAVDVADTYAKRKHKAVRIGAKATYPEVNWGYLKFSDQVGEIHNVKIFAFDGQIEKPDVDDAKRYVASFEYLWNTGYMVWPGFKIVEAYKRYSKDAGIILSDITKPGYKGDIVEEYKKLNKTSIDYEILEKADNKDFVVIPVDAGWSDVGDWRSLKTQLEKNEHDNVKAGNAKNVITMDTSDTLIYSDNAKKQICVIGMENVAIVETKDALLICNKDMAKDVKKLVEKLSRINDKLI